MIWHVLAMIWQENIAEHLKRMPLIVSTADIVIVDARSLWIR